MKHKPYPAGGINIIAMLGSVLFIISIKHPMGIEVLIILFLAQVLAELFKWVSR